MLIATDPLSLVFLACFLFGLLFLIGSAILGNLGHGGDAGHAASHQFHLPAAGHGATGATHSIGHGGWTHVVSQVTSHDPLHGTSAHSAHSAQGNDFSLLSYVNPTSIVLFLLGFGFFG